MKTIKILFFSIFMIAGYMLTAQVAISTNGSSADASAMLDVSSNNKGMLIPRIPQYQIESIANPANGLLVFNTDVRRFYFYDGLLNEWKELAISEGVIYPGGWTCGRILYDARDGKGYATVQIGARCWMAENLNIGTLISSAINQSNNSIIEKYCYNNNTSNCDLYGGLYQWDEMMQYSTMQGTQGICPTGWHIPSDPEWCGLENAVDSGPVQCSLTGWRGYDAGGNLKETGTLHWTSPNSGATNLYGFNALGNGYTAGAQFHNLTTFAYFWSSSLYAGNPWYRTIGYNTAMISKDANHSGYYGYSVRCVKD